MGFHELLFALDDDFMVFADRRNGLSEEAIAALEAELGGPFEAGYRRFLAELGCAAALAKEEVWPRPVPYEVRPRWQMQWGFELFGARSEGPLPAPLDVRVRTAEARRRGRPGVPVLGILGGDSQLAVVDGVLAWLGTKGGCGGRAECGVPEPVEGGFEEVVRELVARLQADKDRYVAERAAQADAEPEDEGEAREPLERAP